MGTRDLPEGEASEDNDTMTLLEIGIVIAVILGLPFLLIPYGLYLAWVIDLLVE